MKLFLRRLVLAPIMACMFLQHAGAQAVAEIGGQNIVTLHRTVTNKSVPEFTSVTVAPGRGMEVLEITANLPGKGSVNVLASPDPAASAKMMEQGNDPNGFMSFRIGGPFLIPYPNRIRGKLSADGQTVTTEWEGHTLALPAIGGSRQPGAERCAVHGLIFKARTDDVQVKSIPDGQQVTGVIHAGDFGGHWLSKTDLFFAFTLTGDAADLIVVARNVGGEAEPIAIGWHPGFTLPSGDRTQARVHLPGSDVAEVDNFDNVFPTGKIKPVAGTQYDLRAPGGVALGKNSYDDNWSKLEWKNGQVTVQVIDPAAHYGIGISALSHAIKTIQMFALPAMPIVAVEPQFNFGDPFGKEWGATDTGMVTLKPGQSTQWHVRLALLDPSSL
jgi:aldose 1-epimerase